MIKIRIHAILLPQAPPHPRTSADFPIASSQKPPGISFPSSFKPSVISPTCDFLLFPLFEPAILPPNRSPLYLIHRFANPPPFPLHQPKFLLDLTIHDLNNVPLVTGTCYVKWHLPSSTSAEHRGHTPKALIRDHKVHWSHHRRLPVRLTIDKHNVLCDSWVEFEVLQEYTARERIFLGRVSVNIAEFVEQGDEGGGGGEQLVEPPPPAASPPGEGAAAAEERRERETMGSGTSRRYLMQDSKINSTLKIGVRLRQTEGPTDYTAPLLKTANTFGGIAGIHVGVGAGMGSGGEQASRGGADGGEDGSTMPSMSSKAQESGKTQDMYRQNLAATWAAQAGELPPDQCIEDIFAGGDGWADKGAGGAGGAKGSGFGGGGGGRGASGSMGTDDGERTIRGHERNASGATLKPSSQGRHHWRRHSREKQASGGSGSGSGNWSGSNAGHSTVGGSGTSHSAVTGRTGIEQQVQAHHRQGTGQDPDHSKWAQNVRMRELNEFEEREDLRSWEIGVPG